jgi:hypothetical protein
LFDRLRERKITADDLYQLKTWRESDPDAPDGLWYRTSVRSKSVAKEDTRRPSCSRASLPEPEALGFPSLHPVARAAENWGLSLHIQRVSFDMQE